MTESPSLTAACYLSMLLPFLLPFAFMSLSLTHSDLFTEFILISVNPSLYLCSLLFYFSLTHKNCLPRSPNHTFSTFYLLPFLFTLSVSLTINYLMFFPTCCISCFFLSRVPQFAPIPYNFFPTIFLSFLLPHTFSNYLCPSLSDPEQSVHELVYDLRSQCDAIRVTKTVRPYRMVVCPVNENNAALMVSDGRAMLWELKAHTAKAAANPRYTHTHTHAQFAGRGNR